jgi:hypothetical protein
VSGGHGHVIPRPDGVKACCGGALLALAAEFERQKRETFAEATAHAARGDDDAALMASAASDTWSAAARRTRLRAQGSSSGASEPGPVSGEGQEPAGDLSALPQAAIDTAAIQHAEYRGWTDPEPEDAGIAADMLAAAAPYIRNDERDRMRQAILGCLTCGQVHTCRQVPGPAGELPGWTWSDPEDGHTYWPAHLASPGPGEALSAALGDGDG